MTADLRRLSLLLLLIIGGAGVLFVVCAMMLAWTHPNDPANGLVNRYTVWLFVPSAILAATGIYIRVRYWRCPYCRYSLSTRFPIPRDCPRCKRDVGLYD